MASKACVHRLQREYKKLLKDPVPHLTAHPSPSNLLRWHFVFEGAKGTDFEHGVYHGRIEFSTDYPYKPPSMMMLTPSGRFTVQHKLCLSNSDYHPESWNPMWSVASILTGLLSVMHDTSREASYAAGSISASSYDRRRLARQSLAYNVKNPIFCKLFPEYVEEHAERRACLEQGMLKCRGGYEQVGEGGTAVSSATLPGGAIWRNLSGIVVVSLLVVICAVLLVPLLRQDGIGPYKQ